MNVEVVALMSAILSVLSILAVMALAVATREGFVKFDKSIADCLKTHWERMERMERK